MPSDIKLPDSKENNVLMVGRTTLSYTQAKDKCFRLENRSVFFQCGMVFIPVSFCTKSYRYPFQAHVLEIFTL